MHSLTALVLAGGFGTRLQSVVKDVPKPMADVRGEPFLAHLMRYYIAQGVTQFILSVGYKAEVIQSYFGDRFDSANIRYIVETTPLGTGGAIKCALSQVPAEWQPQLILNGDTWYEPNVLQLKSFAQAKHRPVCLSVKPIPVNDRYGSVLLEAKGNINGFRSEPNDNANINAGCYFIEPIALRAVLNSYPETFSFEADCLPNLAKAQQLSGYVMDATFLDIGIPADYAKAASLLKG
jgi:D-glycero-alpha-D-manno-heptose 1-phosphate guanylyltransferase